MCWRPVVGLTPDDAGGLVERVLTRVVLEGAVAAHNDDVEQAKKG